MEDVYDKKYLFDTLYLLSSNIDELSLWSVYNDDILLEKIEQIREQIKLIRNEFIELDKKGELEKGGE